MFLSNLHTHTFYSDGKSGAEEYIKSAIEKGFVSIGFSDHSPLEIPKEYIRPELCDIHLTPASYLHYRAEIQKLKLVYQDNIEVYFGIEEDYYQPAQRDGVEFTIGAVHYLQSPQDKQFYCVDYSTQELLNAAASFGSMQTLVEAYYKRLLWVVTEQKPDVLAHFDLINKVNSDHELFDTSEQWYRDSVLAVLDALEQSESIPEMNSGAIVRGYKKRPYPEEFILRELFRRGIPMTISSDAHHVGALDAYYPEMIALAKEVGYRSAKILRDGSFHDVSI